MNLFFANPILLWGLLAGAIPLLIHLLRKQRAHLQVLPTLRFLAEAHRKQLVTIRFQDLLLLVIRTLLILTLVLALAGPKMLLTAGGRGFPGWLAPGNVQRVLLIDNSLSMMYRENAGTRHEQALRSARTLLDEMPANVETLIVGFSDGSEEEERAIPASFTTDRDRLIQQLNTQKPVIRPSHFSWGIRRASQLLGDAADGGIFLFTDLQKSGWEELFAARVEPGEFQYPISVIDVSQTQSRNLWLQDVRLPALPTGLGEETALKVEVASGGFPEGTDIPIRLALKSPAQEGQQEKVLTERELLLSTGQTLSLSLPFTPDTPERFQATLELSSQEVQDPLIEDNSIEITLPVLNALDVLVLMEMAAPSGGESFDLQSEEAFLRSSFKLALETPGRENLPPFLRCHLFNPVREEVMPLESYPVVLLYGPPTLSAEWQSHLLRHAREGHGLLVFLDPEWRESDRDRTARMAWLAELGFNLSPLRAPQQPGTLILKDVYHPAFQAFGAFGPQLLSSVRAWQAMEIADATGTALAQIRMGLESSESLLSPVISERVLDSGRLMVCGIPLQRAKSNLGTSPAWVPLLQQLVKYLATPEQQMPPERLETLFPGESDLTRLTAAEQESLQQKMPISFSSMTQLSQAISRGQGSRDLTRAFLMVTLLLGCAEMFLANRMR